MNPAGMSKVFGRMRPAGERLLNFAQSGIGEEVLEGVVGGGLVGAGLLATDQPIEQTALQTALAMAGGVGLGMGARRIGARMGRSIHPEALAEQQGMLASLGRMSGQEGLVTGARDSLSQMSQSMRKELRGNTMKRVRADFSENPAKVARDFGMTEDQFREVLPLLEQADDVFTPLAAQEVDQIASRLKRDAPVNVNMTGDTADASQALGDLQNFIGDAMTSAPSTITGEHIGRMVGRAAGDEAGIVGGVALGGLIGQGMGWESEKDREIRLLKEQLG